MSLLTSNDKFVIDVTVAEVGARGAHEGRAVKVGQNVVRTQDNRVFEIL